MTIVDINTRLCIVTFAITATEAAQLKILSL